jgi:ABC-type sugar transport system permease subunit
MAFFEFRMGAAAGVAWFLFLMILVVTIINWRFGEKTVHYV